MRRVILIVLGLIVVVIAGFAIVVALQPADFHIERSATIAAPQAVVFAQVNDFHSWQAWSPWAKLDKEAKLTYEGPASGKGAIFKWSGNNEVGEGSMTLVESRPNDLIKIKLDFVKPMEGSSDAEFTFKPQGNQTVVTWKMDGKNNFFAKAFCLFVNMDKMLGDEFDKGLAGMKSVAEAKQ